MVNEWVLGAYQRSASTQGPPGFPWLLLLNIYQGNWKGPRGLLKNVARFPKDVGSSAPRTRRPRRKPPLTKQRLHTGNCLVPAKGPSLIGVPSRESGEQSTFARPISPRQPLRPPHGGPRRRNPRRSSLNGREDMIKALDL